MRRRSSFSLAMGASPGSRGRGAPRLTGWISGLMVLAVASCGGGEDPEAGGGCSPIEARFQTAWNTVLGAKCIACHTAQGVAKHSKLRLTPASQTGWESANLEMLRELARYQVDGDSVLLVKPTLRVPHSGGQVIAPGSAEEAALVALVEGLESGGCTTVAPAGADTAYFAEIELLDAAMTYRRAAIVLAGRVPTSEELALLDEGGDEALPGLIDTLLAEPAFVDRVAEVWNDKLLTNKYDRGHDAVNLLSKEDYPQRKWWEAEGVDAAEKALADRHTNHAVAREPLELIAHVVRNDLPFTDVVTADYTVVNPYSARVFGIAVETGAGDAAPREGAASFTDPADPTEWRAAKIPGVPHAGVLTSPMVLNRFPTTDTNRNRARARLVWNLFLATDVMRVAERPIDPTGIADHNPTLFNASCTVCHELIDPIAGTFAAWDATGRFRPPAEGWYPDMRPPGFGAEAVPFGEESRGLQWLGQRLGADPRFALAAVRTAFTLLTGQPVLEVPTEEERVALGEVGAAARSRAATAQTAELTAVAEAFVADGLRFKSAVRRLVLSPWFRARDARPGLAAERLRELGDVGSGRLLTPEELDRKITSAVGVAWTRGWDERHALRDPETYALFYGGIDSDTVTRRLTSPNGLMAAVQERMANEVACRATARDFLYGEGARVLFPHVEPTFEPLDINGFVIPEAEARIRDNLRHLALRLLGERLADGDPDLEALFELFVDVWLTGRDAVIADEEDEWLPWECQAKNDPLTGEELPEGQRIDRDRSYTVRAWSAVLSAILSDFRFLTE